MTGGLQRKQERSEAASGLGRRFAGARSDLTRPPEERVATNVLIIGAGGAGLRAAIELTEQGVRVLCTAKRPSRDAHTVLAQGGINAALGDDGPG